MPDPQLFIHPCPDCCCGAKENRMTALRRHYVDNTEPMATEPDYENSIIVAVVHADDADREIKRLKALALERQICLQLILDAIDYTHGACQVNEMVGACLDKRILERARKAATT